MLSSGRLRHRVRIEAWTLLVDSNGEAIQNPATGEESRRWEEVATVWGAIEPLSAREFIAAQAVQSHIVARITIRYRDGLDAAMRLVHVRTGKPDVIYSIGGVLVDKDSGVEYITCPVSAGVNAG